MTVTQALLGFMLIAGLLTIIPGLDTALVLRSAITRGRAYAIVTGLGISTGSLVWGMAAALGASALLAASRTGYRVLTLVGAGYLIWLGAQMLWRTWRRRNDDDAEPAAPVGRRGLLRAWLTGVGTNLLNPKVGVFYLAVIPQFIPAGVSPLAMGALLALSHGVLGMLWFGLLIGLTQVSARWLQSPRVRVTIDRVTGGVLVAFGLRLALHRP